MKTLIVALFACAIFALSGCNGVERNATGQSPVDARTGQPGQEANETAQEQDPLDNPALMGAYTTDPETGEVKFVSADEMREMVK